jgi:hypothetical protein
MDLVSEFNINLNKKTTMKTMNIYTFKQILFLTAYMMVLIACTKTGDEAGNQSGVMAPDIELQEAVITGNLEAVQQHIEAGTDINKKEQMTGSTPLITAATFNKTEIAEVLIDAGADLSIQNNDGATALHVAAFFCRVEIVQMLMDAGADKSVRNNFGVTARESVMGPFPQVKPIYEMMQQQLQPFGLELDLEEIEKTRPVIAMMLQ